jgi:hypothetical protein
MLNKLVGTRHNPLRRGMQFGQFFFFLACNSDAANAIYIPVYVYDNYSVYCANVGLYR